MHRLAQLARYGLVSVIATGTSLLVLGLLVTTRVLTPGWANVAATAVGTVPSFELNRRWVWHRHGTSSVRSEVIPFAALSAAGLILSTLVVSLAGRWAAHAALTGATRTVVIQAASISAFGALWLVQFAILDRLLFADRAAVGQDQRIPIPSR